MCAFIILFNYSFTPLTIILLSQTVAYPFLSNQYNAQISMPDKQFTGNLVPWKLTSLLLSTVLTDLFPVDSKFISRLQQKKTRMSRKLTVAVATHFRMRQYHMYGMCTVSSRRQCRNVNTIVNIMEKINK